MTRDTILRRTSAAPLRALSSPSSTNSSRTPAVSTPACGAGARRTPSPAGTTGARRDGITVQRQGLVSHQAVEAMNLNVHTVKTMVVNGIKEDIEAEDRIMGPPTIMGKSRKIRRNQSIPTFVTHVTEASKTRTNTTNTFLNMSSVLCPTAPSWLMKK